MKSSTLVLLYRISFEEHQNCTLPFVAHIFFGNQLKLVFKFQPISHSEGRLMLENRLRMLRRSGQAQEVRAATENFEKARFQWLIWLLRIASIQQQLPRLLVKVIAVTKQVSVEHCEKPMLLEFEDFGESRVQEAEFKQKSIARTDITWHFVGDFAK